MNTQDFNQAKYLIDKSTSIVLTTHERTDGDDLGSVLALSKWLMSLGKQVSIVIKGGVPETLRFLPGSEMVLEELPKRKFDLFIVSGCSVRSRIGQEELMKLEIPIINIDHHPDNSQYGTVNVVDAVK